MTANRKQKKAIRSRAEAADIPYTAARRRELRPGGPGLTAQHLWRRIAARFDQAGWPLVVEEVAQFGRWVLYAGPMQIAVEDPDLDPNAAEDMRADDEPDRPLSAGSVGPGGSAAAGPVELCAPFLGARPGAAAAELAGTATADDVVSTAVAIMARARERSLEAAVADEECTICGQRFPVDHLLCPTPADDMAACPACVFDGDLTMYYADPPWLAHQLDALLDSDLAAPAAWGAVAMLLAAGAGVGLAQRLERDWRAAGVHTLPLERWQDPDHNWIWLPRPTVRPTWLAGFGPGARPSALVAALDTAHPELRTGFRDELHDGFLIEVDQPVPEPATLELGWLLAVAYAVALHTDTVEHPERRDPWHALTSFDSLDEHLEGLGGADRDIDDLLLTAMISAGVRVLHEHGAVPSPQASPADPPAPSR